VFVNQETFDTLPREFDETPIEVVLVQTEGRSRLRRVLAEQMVLPRKARSHKLDLLHSLGSTAPARLDMTSVVTVNDVIYALHPEAHTRAMRTGLRVLVPLGARRADRLIAISESAAREVADVLSLERERIDVVHLAGRPVGPPHPVGAAAAFPAGQRARCLERVRAAAAQESLLLLRAFARLEPRRYLSFPATRLRSRTT
jgi:hypothetical protein